MKNETSPKSETMSLKQFSAIPELVSQCRYMNLGDEDDFTFQGDLKNTPSTIIIQDALNDELHKLDERKYFQCKMFEPLVYSVRCYDRTHGWDKFVL